MDEQLKILFTHAKLNFVVLGSILLIAILGKVTYPQLTISVFTAADQLVSDLYLVFIAITLGAFVPNFRLVLFGSLFAFVGALVLIRTGGFTHLTVEYVLSILIVTLGFASIANLYRHYREMKF
jgi:hypothetical protein